MQIIVHRRNTISELVNTSENYGIEIDIRTQNDNLIIHHDPFQKGEFFSRWLDFYKHGTLIINLKEEGLENDILEIMSQKKINDFFFLDQSFPFLIKTSLRGESRSAVRVSEYESIETALTLKGKVDWVWVDFFNKFPLNFNNFNKLKESNFKLCLVSPELQNKSKEIVKDLRRHLEDQKMYFDAVCTKYPNFWE